ncbi:MAG: histidine kinase N-terminal 7TM domain-containing protein [Chloroflexota bacterium]|nr:histidine kinase N-terminal 7TM domain-containing protein [Chloroflexota bacterium]
MLPFSWYFNPYMIPLVVTGIVAAIFVVYSLRRPSVLTALPFAALCFCVMCWTLGTAIQISTNEVTLARLMLAIQHLGLTGVAPSWFLFACLFTGRERWLERRRLLALYAGPALMLLAFLTNDLHGWMLSPITLVENRIGNNFDYSFHWMFWIHALIAYVLIVSGSAITLNYALTSDRAYRSQAFLSIFSSVIPLLANVIVLIGLNPLPIDLTPLAFGVSMIAFSINLFRFRLFDLVPLTYEKLLGTLKEGVIVLDTQNRIVQTNAAALELVGWSNGRQMIGLSAAVAFASMQPAITPYIEQAEREGEIKITAPRVEGERAATMARWLNVRVSPLTMSDRSTAQVRGKVIVLSEVTARKQNELALAEARDHALQLDQFKTQVLSDVSHDLRTPLAAIQGFAELLQGGFYDNEPDKQAHALQSIINDAHYLNQLVNQLLDKSALNSGRIELKPVAFAPASLVRTTVEGASILAEAKGLTLRVDISADLPAQLSGDPDRIQQIITNLTGNAIKFTERGGVVVRVFCPDAGHWAIQVTDTGHGIPPNLQDAIFEPFRQLNQGQPQAIRTRGFGLGLTIVKDLTTMMNGEVTVESHVGQGSSFTATFPIIVP